jgi:hypothetical protein
MLFKRNTERICFPREMMVGCFIGAFAKFRKQTISLVMSVRLCIRPHGTTRLPLDGFSQNFIREHFFENLSRKVQVSLKAVKNDGYFT